jgi:MFS transporter, ACS family, D-galactonate transporter
MVSTNFFEGMILVATPALIRDFSPQLGRASAMGFWTLGPVIGSLTVTSVASATLPSHPDWQFQFRLCGAVGVAVFVLAFAGLRELSPRLRDQLMVSIREKVLVEARAAGIDPDTALKGSWRQMLTADVVGPAFAISIFLLFYHILVGFFVVYYALTFGYTEARANALANWYWGANAIALVAVGLASDRLRVRKPFMVGGALLSAGGVAAFAVLTTHQGTGYYTFAWLLSLIAVGNGVAYCGWMAAFTETVERHNPAATATGLAIWGGILRGVVTLTLVGLIFVVPSARVLVDHGPEVRTITTAYATEIATLDALSPRTHPVPPCSPAAGARGGPPRTPGPAPRSWTASSPSSPPPHAPRPRSAGAQGALPRDRPAYFTEPAVRPPTRCFSISANRITTGTTAMIEAAKSWSQACW